MSIASILDFKRRPNLHQGQRNHVYLSTTILTSGRPFSIHLLDLSRHGALTHANDTPQDGEIVWVVCHDIELLARTTLS